VGAESHRPIPRPGRQRLPPKWRVVYKRAKPRSYDVSHAPTATAK
jgi:hypothetical protein